MNEAQIKELAKKITNKILKSEKHELQPKTTKEIEKVIADYIDSDEIYNVGGFTKEDIIEEAKRMGYECNDEIAQNVMDNLDHEYDANIGMSWAIIETELMKFHIDKMKQLAEKNNENMYKKIAK